MISVKRLPLLITILVLLIKICPAQIAPVEGIRSNPPRVWALTGATVHSEPGQVLAAATIIVRDGLIAAVGKDLTIPADATVVDCAGLTIYAGFIDSWLPLAVPADPVSPVDHWHGKVRADRLAVALQPPEGKRLQELRSLGFTAAQAVAGKGIFRGSAGLIQLQDKPAVFGAETAQVVAFETAGYEAKEYPNSLMGAIALVRQTLLDAEWYRSANEIYRRFPDQNEAVPQDQSLAALDRARQAGTPFLFPAGDEQEVLRAAKVAAEFKLSLLLRGSGYEYRRAAEIAALKTFLILDMNYPAAPAVEQPWLARLVTTEELKHWDLAPDNARIMVAAGMPLGLTPAGLKKCGDFRKNLIRSIERGLPPVNALAALTTTPARYLGQADRMGKIAPGFIANLTVVEGDYFDSQAPLRAVWIAGEQFKIERDSRTEIAGDWDLRWLERDLRLTVREKQGRLTAAIELDSLKLECKQFVFSAGRLSWLTATDSLGLAGWTRFSGALNGGRLNGSAVLPTGQAVAWEARRRDDQPEDNATAPPEAASDLAVFYPEGACGFEQTPQTVPVILVNDATIWTCGPQGIREGWDALFINGKIEQVAPAIAYPQGGALIIDGTGKHLTPGIIDCHSHTAGLGVNEGTHSNAAEVRIEDVLDADDISIYRQLAGGVTTIHVLHGSANTIGGQNAVIKLRWGNRDRDLVLKNAPPGIKFALGENVKQSNWGDDYKTRYPQTRLGTEQFLRDSFTAARDYRAELRRFERDGRLRKTRIPPRRDLGLEALAEVIDGKRLLHCHAYRQDEMLALIRLAEEFGFRLATFQHTLEGYKIADELKAHGVAASSFSDWWAYKFEVYDAIPHNGSLMHAVGVSVSFNSDDDELARRLNTEAAKAIKYGGMSEEDALKLVTINSARQLGIDRWVGSLEPGKDADFVLWNANPLSTLAVPEQTWIDGKLYFSLEQDQELRRRDEQLRNRLIQKVLDSKLGKQTEQPGGVQ
ncbi:MAG: amidohydrolase family protein [Candidatus Neomarinimicrobiota bacterium]